MALTLQVSLLFSDLARFWAKLLSLPQKRPAELVLIGLQRFFLRCDRALLALGQSRLGKAGQVEV